MIALPPVIGLVLGDGKRQDSDIVPLTESLCPFGNVTGGHQGKVRKTIEAVEFAAVCARFRHTIRQQGETLEGCSWPCTSAYGCYASRPYATGMFTSRPQM